MFEGDEGIGAEVTLVHQDRELGGSGDVGGLGVLALGEKDFCEGGGAEVVFGGLGSELFGRRKFGGRDEGGGFADGTIAGAAAEVATKLIRDGGGVVLDAACGAFCHGANKAGGAVAALGTVAGDHRGLRWVQFFVLGEAFGGEKFATDERMNEGEAAVDGAGWAGGFEEKEGAGAAVAFVAADFGTGEAVETEKFENVLMEGGRRDVGGFSIDSDGGGHERLLGNAVDVFVVEVGGGFVADGSEPLRAIGSHPNGVAGVDRIVFFFEAIDAVATEHEQAVFHDVGFDKGKGGAGLVSENVEGEVEGGMDGEEGLEEGALVAHEGLGLDVVDVAVGDGGGGVVEVGLVDFAKNGEAGFGFALEGDFGMGGKIDEGTRGQFDGRFLEDGGGSSGLEVASVFVFVGGEVGSASFGLIGEEKLGEVGSHRGGDDDVGNGIDPAGKFGGNMTIGCNEGMAAGETGASVHRLELA